MGTVAMETTKGLEPMKDFTLKIVRTFDAPRELVWRAISETEMAMQWAGPRGFRATEFVIPKNVGDEWRMTMVGKAPMSDEPFELKQHGTVVAIDPPRKLAYTFAWEQRCDVGLGQSPYKENTVTFELEEKGKQTVMTFTQGPFATEGECQGHTGGWNSAFDKFAVFLLAEQPGRVADDLREVHIQRVFVAPRELVFDAWTKPEMIAQWWGPVGATCTAKKWDARGGGEIDLMVHTANGMNVQVKGQFVEVYPPYRMHFTGGLIGKDGKPLFKNWNSVFLEEVEGGTLLTLDIHTMDIAEGAESSIRGRGEGWSTTLDKLDKLLVKQGA